MVLKLISATPSPYARKVRIQLQEKNIPFDLANEVPWDHTTETPQHNPLEKLPVLIFDESHKDLSKDGQTVPEPIYESAYIIEYVEAKMEPRLSLTPKDMDDIFVAKKLEVLADSICDAGVLSFFEQQRPEDKRSKEWMDRQQRKIDGGLKTLNKFAAERQKGSDYLVGGQLTTADLAVVSCVDFIGFQGNDSVKAYPELVAYAKALNDKHASFRETKPVMFDMKDKVVKGRVKETLRGVMRPKL